MESRPDLRYHFEKEEDLVYSYLEVPFFGGVGERRDGVEFLCVCVCTVP